MISISYSLFPTSTIPTRQIEIVEEQRDVEGISPARAAHLLFRHISVFRLVNSLPDYLYSPRR